MALVYSRGSLVQGLTPWIRICVNKALGLLSPPSGCVCGGGWELKLSIRCIGSEASREGVLYKPKSAAAK